MLFEGLPIIERLMHHSAVFTILLFAAVVVLAYAIFGLLMKQYDSPLRQRLRGPTRDDPLAQPAQQQKKGLPPIVERLGRAAAKPLLPKQREDVSRLRRKLGYAGYYNPSAMHLYAAFKIILLFAFAAAGLLFGAWVDNMVVGAWMGGMLGLIGLMLPSAWLSYSVRSHQRELQDSLPDALDLMVVCVEAGLTVDAALQRVGQEIALAHPDISRELAMTHMETRIGVARSDALRNLGHRTGSPALQSLAAMLVQAERFGTSIGTALRVHADSLRVKRQHEAEERAAKTTVKLAFPVVLFIFPTVIAVLGGPAFILFFKSPLFSN